jgi:Domain of unknown function (DUF4249)
MKKLLLFALPLLALLSSCDDKIDLDLQTTTPYIVMDGYVDNLPESVDTIRLSSTIGYLDQGKLPVIGGATVLLSGTDGTLDTLQEVVPGKYITSAGWAGQVGQTYTVDVTLADGTKFKAADRMPRHQVLDSINTITKKDNPPFDDGPYVGVWFREQAGKGDYFIFELVRNDTLQNLPQDLFAVDDNLTDGQQIQGPVLNNDPYQIGDSVTVRVVSISKEAYFFYNELQVQINNGGLFSQPPANVRTNFVNVSPGSNKRTSGYFFVRSITSASTVLK